ncbi:MAG: DUF2975 domain-containing protein [Bacteroidetes bacterium]|nr:DUF2975 domain-containing protein [Bacteroidota bacterium]
MSTKSDYILKLLNVVSWIIFIGVCIEAGAFIVNTFFTLLLNPEGAKRFWMEVNLSELYYYNQSYYVTVTSLMIIVAVLRALMFYHIVKFLNNKELRLSQPFNETTRRFILKIAYMGLGIGLFSFWGAKVAEGLVKQGVRMPEIQYLRLGGADVWLFLGVILLVIAQIFKRGIEIQNEIDLTV